MKAQTLFLGVALLGIGVGGCSSSSPAAAPEDSGTAQDTGTGQGIDSGTGGGQDSSTGGQDSSTGGNDSGGGEVDSSTGNDAEGITDTGTGTPTWVDMDFADGAANGHACDNLPGVPCGWSATNGGAGYTCRCLFPADLDPWGCSAPDSGAPLSCPAPDAGGD